MINVDTVYKTVLLILNKEQRGYITPSEFNRLGTQVQLEIFEQYFEDLTQQLRIPQNNDEYANRVKNIEEKISTFKVIETLTPLWVVSNEFTQPTTLHRMGIVIYKNEQELQRVNRSDWLHLNMSKLTRPSADYPMFIYEEEKIYVQPEDLVTTDALTYNDFTIAYVKKPENVVWGYLPGPQGQYLYDSTQYDPIALTGSQNFEISDQDQTEVIIKILMYAGVVIRDPQIVQAAAAQVQATDQNEKT